MEISCEILCRFCNGFVTVCQMFALALQRFEDFEGKGSQTFLNGESGIAGFAKISRWARYILIKGAHKAGCSLPHAMTESTRFGQEGQK